MYRATPQKDRAAHLCFYQLRLWRGLLCRSWHTWGKGAFYPSSCVSSSCPLSPPSHGSLQLFFCHSEVLEKPCPLLTLNFILLPPPP